MLAVRLGSRADSTWRSSAANPLHPLHQDGTLALTGGGRRGAERGRAAGECGGGGLREWDDGKRATGQLHGCSLFEAAATICNYRVPNESPPSAGMTIHIRR